MTSQSVPVPLVAGEATLLQAAAALSLWRSGQFDTTDIALVLHMAEADVCRVLSAVSVAERGAALPEGSS